MNPVILKWIANACVVAGAAIIAVSPDYAAKSIIPFIILICSQAVAIYSCVRTKDWPFLWFTMCFVVLDMYAIFIRLN